MIDRDTNAPPGRSAPVAIPLPAGEAPLHLSPALEPRRPEFAAAVVRALGIVAGFAARHGWDAHMGTPFFDAVAIFDDHAAFRDDLFRRLGLPADTPFPSTYVAALDGRVLTAIPPEVFRANVPAFDEPEAWPKLLAHEIAHRLHARILGGDEDRMGPVWFFEGFALVAAGQLEGMADDATPAALAAAVRSPERGDYRLYAGILRRLLATHPLPALVARAAESDFSVRSARFLEGDLAALDHEPAR